MLLVDAAFFPMGLFCCSKRSKRKRSKKTESENKLDFEEELSDLVPLESCVGDIIPPLEVFRVRLRELNVPFDGRIVAGKLIRVASSNSEILRRSPQLDMERLDIAAGGKIDEDEKKAVERIPEVSDFTAVKKVKSHFAAIDQNESLSVRVADVLREVAAQKDANACDFVVKIYSACYFEKEFFIEMEYLPMGDMLDWLMCKKPDFRRPLEIEKYCAFSQISCAIATIHRLGWIHYDIKPENVMLDCNQSNELVFKLCDFGLARRCAPNEYLSVRSGALEYVAPEILWSQLSNHLADVFSFGVLMMATIFGVHLDRVALKEEVMSPTARCPSYSAASQLDEDEVGRLPIRLLEVFIGALRISLHDRIDSNALHEMLEAHYEDSLKSVQ